MPRRGPHRQRGRLARMPSAGASPAGVPKAGCGTGAPSRVLLVALEQLDRDALRPADEADADAGPDRRWLHGEFDAFCLDLGGHRVDILYGQAEMVEPLIRRDGRGVDAIAGRHRGNEHIGAAKLDVDPPGTANDNAAQDIFEPGGRRLRVGTAQVDVIPSDYRHGGLPFGSLPVAWRASTGDSGGSAINFSYGRSG